jgi:hypothetical protein
MMNFYDEAVAAAGMEEVRKAHYILGINPS